jgi:TetR/AcrR family transcriptional repressor of nem operon
MQRQFMARKQVASQTADEILSIAQRLVQSRGFNAFSYADIAAELGITKASLHYHFPSKAELGAKLIARYDHAMLESLAKISASAASPSAMLRQYANIYSSVLADGFMCLCGMLAAEFTTLPEAMQEALDTYFKNNERWLAGVLAAGRESGELSFEGEPGEAAQFFVGGLEGAMMMARSHGGSARFDAARRRLLAEFGA